MWVQLETCPSARMASLPAFGTMKTQGTMRILGSRVATKLRRPLALRMFRTLLALQSDDESLLREIFAHCKRGEAGKAMHSFCRLVDRGSKVPPGVVASLVSVCGRTGHAEGLKALQSHVVLQIEDPVNQTLLSALVSVGQASCAVSLYQMMMEQGVQLRLGGLSAVLGAATELKNCELASEILAKFERSGWVPPLQSCCGVMQLAVESGERSLVERLLSVLRASRVDVDESIASLFRDWVQRLPGDRTATQSSVCEGVCGVCGHVLERNELSKEGHLRLLEQVEQHLRMSVDAFEDNRKEHDEVLAFTRMMSSEPPPMAVLDGLNVAYQSRCGWRQVVSVASRLTSLLQGPVLIIARQHLAHKFTIRGQRVSSVAAIYRHFRPQGIHFFFTVNRVEDDNFFLYASLASGRKTYFVSNDELGDHAHQYPPEVLPLFKQWQHSCQVMMDTKTGLLKFPEVHDRVVQWTDTNWHLPLQGGDNWLCAK